MKQRITQEQMDELTSQEKLLLADWADPKDDLDWERDGDGRIYKYKLPLLTIGQMIEFLHEKPLFSKRPHGYFRRGMDGKAMWIVETPRCNYFEEEFVDALWEAIKGALNNVLSGDWLE